MSLDAAACTVETCILLGIFDSNVIHRGKE